MPTTKYHGKTTVILYAATVDTAPTVDLSGSSRTISLQEQGNEIDVTTRDDAVANATASLSTPPSRTISLQGLDTTPDSSRDWNDINVQDEGRVAIYPFGTGSSAPYEIGNVICTNRNYDSPYDNAATYQVDWRVNGTWTKGTVA